MFEAFLFIFGGINLGITYMKKFLLALLISASTLYAVSQTTVYITEQGAGSKDGSSWANALDGQNIQSAINNTSHTGGGQIWIAEGTYKPTQDTSGNGNMSVSRSFTFTMRPNVSLFGGFWGNETALSQRTKYDKNGDGKIEGWEFANETILSGDIDGDGTYDNNAYHVISDMVDNIPNLHIDGFIVQDGAADGKNYDSYIVFGGGIFAKNTKITCCIFQHNTAVRSGGGIFITNDAEVDSCLVTNNYCNEFAGAIAINEVGIVKNSLILSNDGGNLGGIICNAGGTIISCNIVNNKNYGVYLNGSGLVIGCNVFNNERSGIFNNMGTILSTTIANNQTKSSNSFYNGTVMNSIIADYDSLTPAVNEFQNNMAYSTKDTVSNIKIKKLADFHFVKPTSFCGLADNAHLSELLSANWNLTSTSPAVDAGMPDVSYFGLPEKDINGKKRIKNGRIDIGANEFNSIQYITPNGNGFLTGENWENAYSQDSLVTAVAKGGDIWMSGGTYNIGNWLNLSTNPKIYGGLAVGDTSIDNRAQTDLNGDGKLQPWEFSNETVINNTLPTEYIDFMDEYFETYLFDGLYSGKGTRLDGLTLTSSYDLSKHLSGNVQLSNGLITNCIITNNMPDGQSAIVKLSNAVLSNSLITENYSYYSTAAILADNGSEVNNCEVSSNAAGGEAAGIDVYDGIIRNTKIVNNMNAGGVGFYGCGVTIHKGTIDNCLIANNTLFGNGARGGGVFVYGSSDIVTIKNSTIIHNSLNGNDNQAPDLGVKGGVVMINSIVGSPIFYQGVNVFNKISYSAIVGGYNGLGAGKQIIPFTTIEDLEAQFENPSTYLGRTSELAYPFSWQLKNNSTLINKGNGYSNQGIAGIDLAGNARIMLDTIDIGAYEKAITEPISSNIKLHQQNQINKDSLVFLWNAVQADHYSLFVKMGTSGVAQPQNGKTYITNKQIGNGTAIDGWYCVYDGKGTTASVTGIMQGSAYKVMLIPSNGNLYRVYSSLAEDGNNMTIVNTKREQSILLNLPDTVRGATDFIANVSTTSGLGVTLSSSFPNIASVLGTKITTLKEGITYITAIQEGNSLFFPASALVRLVVKKASQQIIGYNAFPLKKVGSSSFKILAKSSSGLPIFYVSSNPAVAEVVENEVTINAPGVCNIIASVDESDAYLGISKSQTLIVSAVDNLKMPLYTIDRDTAINLDDLIVSNDAFTFEFLKAKNLSATVNGSMANIVINKNNKAWIGTDTVWFTATNNSVIGDVQTLGIKIRRRPLVEEIGLITVDSSTSTRCIVAWERSKNAGIKGYIMYRGGNVAGIWDSIGYVSANARSLYIDSNVNVKKQAFQYRMVTVDSNNVRSLPSASHTTMHLMTGVNLQNQPQLWWTPYVGADVESYIIYRKNQTTGKLDSIGSSILTSYTDIDAPTGSVGYRVAIRFAKDINPDNLKSDSGPFSQSLSNMAESELTNIAIEDNESIAVYPNPATNAATLTLPSIGNYSIIIYNVLGQSVSKTVEVENSNSIDFNVSQLSAGIYTIKVQGNKAISTLQFVKE
jgi:hypothetical protein